MIKKDLRQLWTLLKKLKKERILQYIEKNPKTNFKQFDNADWYDYDDGDNLIFSCDNLLSILKERMEKNEN